MALTNMAAAAAARQYIGQAQTNWSQTNAHLGIGDSTTAFAKTQTDLQAATNKLRKSVDAAPTNTAGTLRFSATFGSTEANWDWREWGIFNASTGGDMMNRKVEGSGVLGVKPSGQTWQLVADFAIGA